MEGINKTRKLGNECENILPTFFCQAKRQKRSDKQQTNNELSWKLKTENGKLLQRATTTTAVFKQMEKFIYVNVFLLLLLGFGFFLWEINQQMGFQFPINTPRQKWTQTCSQFSPEKLLSFSVWSWDEAKGICNHGKGQKKKRKDKSSCHWTGQYL